MHVKSSIDGARAGEPRGEVFYPMSEDLRDALGSTEHDALRALRELVVNALTHRSYDWSNAPVRLTWFSSRIEITSPGGPFGVVTAENFAHRNDYRNPELAAAMKHLGYVDRFGRGITVVRRTLEANGNSPAEFAIEATYWSVTVRAVR